MYRPLKFIIKRTLQHAAARLGRHTCASNKPQLLILMYHRILPGNDERTELEEPGMVVTPETFRLHINILKQYFSIVKLSDWIERRNNNADLPARACAITFDDGWVDNYEFAFPILNELDAPATIFLVSDMIGTNDAFWPERLARLVTTVSARYPQYWFHPELAWLQREPVNYRFSDTPPSQEEISALINAVKFYPDHEIHRKLDCIEETLQLDTDNHPPSLLNWQQLTAMLESGIIEAGSHTCHHVRLNKDTPKDLLRQEILDSKAVIEKYTGHQVRAFCFPNGDSCPEALALVKQSYSGAVTTESGWCTADTDSHMLRRIGIHQDISNDKTSFLARISGWM